MPKDDVAAHQGWITRRGGLDLTYEDYAVLAECFSFPDPIECAAFAEKQQAKCDAGRA